MRRFPIPPRQTEPQSPPAPSRLDLPSRPPPAANHADADTGEIRLLTERIAHLELAASRARALHPPATTQDGAEYCQPCSQLGPVPYPCPTVRALDGHPIHEQEDSG